MILCIQARLQTVLIPSSKAVSRSPQGQKPKIRSPTSDMLNATAKKLGAQSIFLGAPGYWAPVIMFANSLDHPFGVRSLIDLHYAQKLAILIRITCTY